MNKATQAYDLSAVSTHGIERHAMHRRRPLRLQRRQMFRRSVPLVFRELEPRVVRIQRAHQRVTRRLGEDRRGADRRHGRVAADDGFAARAEIEHVGKPVAVHLHMRGRERQAEQRAAHREEARLQDVERVDLLHVRPRDGPAVGPAPDALGERLALRRRELLGIGQSLDRTPCVEHDGGREDRPGERTAASLVQARDGHPHR